MAFFWRSLKRGVLTIVSHTAVTPKLNEKLFPVSFSPTLLDYINTASISKTAFK
jgi:hypothetical protein